MTSDITILLQNKILKCKYNIIIRIKNRKYTTKRILIDSTYVHNYIGR